MRTPEAARHTAAFPIWAMMMTAFLPAAPGSAQATSSDQEEERAILILGAVVEHLFSRDSIPERALPSPASLLRRSTARGVAVLVSMWPSAEFHFGPSAERMPYVTAQVVGAMRRQGLAALEVTEEKARTSGSYAFRLLTREGVSVLCARELLRARKATCEFPPEIALAIRLGYPVPRGEFWDVPVDVYSDQWDSTAQQIQLHFTVRSHRVSDEWRVWKVLPTALISPGR